MNTYLDESTLTDSKAKRLVLIVDDNADNLQVLAGHLTEAGYEVYSAANGVEALRIVDEHPEVQFDLLLTDVVMPEMGGRELAEKIQERMPSTRILFCSGYARDAIFHRGLEEDLFFLPKPYTVSQLLRRVDEALEHSPDPNLTNPSPTHPVAA